MKKSKIWLLFPFKGLDIIDIEHGLDRPLFGDSSLISKTSYQEILNKDSDALTGGSAPIDLINCLYNPTFGEEFHSFITVCRNQASNDEINFIESARKRAYEIASILSVSFLSIDKLSRVCGLVEQSSRKISNTIFVNLDEYKFSAHLKFDDSFSINSSESAFKISRQDITEFLNQSSLNGLSKVLLLQNDVLNKSLHHAITKACICLINSFNLPDITSHILGAITSIEILLTEQPDRYSILQKRLESLIGKESIERYEMEKVFKARNSYIHRGEDIDDYEISLKALALAMSSILTFSNAAYRFESKSSFIAYLDFLVASKKVSDQWSSDQNNSFNQLIRHRENSQEFPFIERFYLMKNIQKN